MSYTGGNSGYVRRLGQIPGSASAPTNPVAGYTAWFDAATLVYTDTAGTVPATTNGAVVNRWDSKDGSYGALVLTTPGGYGAPHLNTDGNGINGLPVVTSVAATFDLLRDVTQTVTIFEGGLLNVDAGTVFAVVNAPVINASPRCIWGDNAGYISSCLYDSSGAKAHAYVYDGAAKLASKAVTQAEPHIVSWLHYSGGLYSGVDDTRTASMATVAAGDMQAAAGFFILLGGTGPGQYLDGKLAEVIFYNTALTETNRKLTEQYLANKYGITLPY